MKKQRNDQNDGQALEIVSARDYVVDQTEALTTLDYVVMPSFVTLWDDYLIVHLNEGFARGSIDGGTANVLDDFIDGKADEALENLAAQRKNYSPATLAGKRTGLIEEAKERARISKKTYEDAQVAFTSFCKAAPGQKTFSKEDHHGIN